jgi:hypothetical protein
MSIFISDVDYFKSKKRREENMKRFMVYVSFTLLLLLGGAGQVQAVTTIDTTPYWDGSSSVAEFGYPDTATYGQVVTAPLTSDTVLKSFSFYMNLPDTCTFRGYVYLWDGSKAAGSALYESPTMSTTGSGNFEEITFNTGGIALTPGYQYVLFASTSKDTGSGVGIWGQPQDQDVYPGSGNGFVYINNGADASQWTLYNWDQNFLGTDGDLAFKATFVNFLIPAPKILYWNDLVLGTDYMGEALANIAGTYLTSIVTTATDLSDFETKVAAGGWDLVVLMIQSWIYSTPKFNAYVSGGGRAILADWTKDIKRGKLFGVTYTGNDNQDVITITDDLLLSGVTNPMSLINPGWGIFSMGLTDTAGTVAATFPNGDAAIVVRANRRTIINGFLTDTPMFASDGVALFENEIITTLPLTVTSPNGGERVPAGGIFNLTWIPSATAVSFNVDLSTDKGLTWKPLARQYSDNFLEWWVPLQKNNKKNCLIKVTGFDSNGVKVGQDISDQVFTIEVVKLMVPNGGEVWTSTTNNTIIWTTNETMGDVGSVKLFYTLNGGTTWKPIITLAGNPGTYIWTVPSVTAPKTKCKVKVVLRNAAGATIGSDISDAFFTIQP